MPEINYGIRLNPKINKLIKPEIRELSIVAIEIKIVPLIIVAVRGIK